MVLLDNNYNFSLEVKSWLFFWNATKNENVRSRFMNLMKFDHVLSNLYQIVHSEYFFRLVFVIFVLFEKI